MMLHNFGLSSLLITFLILLSSLVIGGRLSYGEKKSVNFLICSIVAEFTYFVSMVLLAKIFYTMTHRANVAHVLFKESLVD